MDDFDFTDFCSGGCTAKLGPDFLAKVIGRLPKNKFDPNVLIGYESSDDAAVYKLTENIAIVQTLDFFTPVVKDPYTFGKIAAANALSDIYAMGGDVKVALNIVCFPEKMDSSILVEILKGGWEKVNEAGGVLSGGHSINDKDIKYGLSVTGTIDPQKILSNNGCRIGDKLILTKPLGVGIVSAAYKVGEASSHAYKKAVISMETLNKYAAEHMKKYNVSACTDITGFGFLGHLNEMTAGNVTAKVKFENIPIIEEALDYAKEFLITAAGQRNRNHMKGRVKFENISFAREEILFDPQTSGGLLISVPENEALNLLDDLKNDNINGAVIGEIIEKTTENIIVTTEQLG